MHKPLAMPQKRTGVRIRTLGLLILFSAQAGAQAPREASGSEQPTHNASEDPTEYLAEKAWRILHDGLKETNADKRAKAVRALGLLAGSPEAQKAAILALKDEKPPVRVAAAVALGSMRAEQATGSLEEALGDAEPSVVLAAANSLLLLHDDVGYDTYYEVLTGERRASKGSVQEQLDTLKDKKKVAEMGFEEGIGFIPFGGIGYEIFRTVTKNDSSPIRAPARRW